MADGTSHRARRFAASGTNDGAAGAGHQGSRVFAALFPSDASFARPLISRLPAIGRRIGFLLWGFRGSRLPEILVRDIPATSGVLAARDQDVATEEAARSLWERPARFGSAHRQCLCGKTEGKNCAARFWHIPARSPRLSMAILPRAPGGLVGLLLLVGRRGGSLDLDQQILVEQAGDFNERGAEGRCSRTVPAGGGIPRRSVGRWPRCRWQRARSAVDCARKRRDAATVLRVCARTARACAG